jgi:AraC-like DNA-binding protein
MYEPTDRELNVGIRHLFDFSRHGIIQVAMKLDLLSAMRMPNQSVRLMAAMLNEHSIPVQPLLDSANIPAAIVDDPQGDVSGLQELQFQEAFAKATHDQPAVWFRLGLRYRLMTYGPLGLAVLSAGTIHEGLKVLVAFQALTYSLLQYKLYEVDGALAGLEADDAMIRADLREFCLVRALGSATMFLRDMRQPFPLSRIETRLADRDYGIDFASALGVPIIFGASESRWIFAPDAAEMVLPMASPMLEQTYQQLCERLIDEAQVNDDLVGRLFSLLVRATRHYPSAKEAASQLSISERTLNRRLAKQGLGFGDVLDQVRQQRATYLLDRSNLSIEQIGEMLGFAETASFSRAFKRWLSVSPTNYRQRPR